MWNGRSVLLLRSTSVPCCNPHYRHDLDRTVDAIKAATIIGTARLLVICTALVTTVPTDPDSKK